MLKLFTKVDVKKMINQGMTFKQIQEKIGFEDIGQGWGYKSIEAWTLGQNKAYEDKYICYIPEYCFSEGAVKQIEITSLYTVKDFKDLCFGTNMHPEFLFETVDWQHPTSLLDEISISVDVSSEKNDILECIDLTHFTCIGNNRLEAYGSHINYEMSFADPDVRILISFDEFCSELNLGYGCSKYLQIARLYEDKQGNIWYDNEYYG